VVNKKNKNFSKHFNKNKYVNFKIKFLNRANEEILKSLKTLTKINFFIINSSFTCLFEELINIHSGEWEAEFESVNCDWHSGRLRRYKYISPS
jgi:hypothetical protein